MAKVKKLITNLWFDRNAEEAVEFYCSVFNDAKRGDTTYFTKEGFEIHGMPEGTVMTIDFSVLGQDFVALNGGSVFSFSESVSFIIPVETQEDLDYFWNKLGEGGDLAAQQCGWLKDKFGLSWQVVPEQINTMMRDKDQEKVRRVTHAMLRMKKLDISKLEEAFAG